MTMEARQLKIEDIPEAGLVVDETLPRDFVDAFLPQTQELHAEKAGHVRLALHRQGDDVSVAGAADVPVAGVCAGCLKPIMLPLKAKVQLVLFKREPNVPQQEEVEATLLDNPDETDEGAGEFDGKIIDWGDLVREQLLLSLPMAPRCKDDCQGLCPVCGADRNETACQCETKQMDPRWEKLKLLKLKGD
jgi:uncharacterized protein